MIGITTGGVGTAGLRAGRLTSSFPPDPHLALRPALSQSDAPFVRHLSISILTSIARSGLGAPTPPPLELLFHWLRHFSLMSSSPLSGPLAAGGE